MWEIVKTKLLEYIKSLECYHELKYLPRRSGIYFVFDDKDDLVYIGKAVDCYKRWKGHQLKQAFTEEGWRLYFQQGKSEGYHKLEAEEGAYILVFQPYVNKSVKVAL